MNEPDMARKIGDTAVAGLAALGLVTVFWLCRQFDFVNANRMQAYALFIGPGMILEAILYLREKKWDFRFRNRATGTVTTTRFEGTKLKAIVCLLSLAGVVATVWSATFWFKALPQIRGSYCP